ncbi:MAG TPA: glycoside hydrolase family 15 protein [Bdellovibrionales bacterium]|nr:glycoside hydrolase family 15 protein [Bdellovibrionales bacterium]
MAERHTYKFGVIGNCAYIAYIDTCANVVWQCLPRFDSSFIFGGLLDPEKGGRFSISPQSGQESTRQHYIENTNILVTHFETEDGAFEVVDFAPRFARFDRYFKPLMMIRKIRRISGNPRVVVKCEPRGDYGERVAEVSLASNHLRYQGLDDAVRLNTNIPLTYVAQGMPFLLTETKYLALTWGEPFESSLEETCETYLQKTTDYWRVWAQRCTIPDIYQKEVLRSALCLKLHQYEDTGAIIAAGSTSLPEAPGSGRNWDYRFFWARDSYYTLNALNSIGHFEELDRYSHYVQNLAMSANKSFQPLYGITGETQPIERELDLKGYLSNKPVRIGNAAFLQVQNDVYGQLMLSLLPLYVDARIIHTKRLESQELVTAFLDSIEKTIQSPDAGLWEFRNMQNKHCYTYLFHWAGASAAAKIGRQLRDEAIIKRALHLKAQAAEGIEACYNPEMKAYCSYIGGTALDASLFQLLTLGYLQPNSERAASHILTMEEGLRAKGGLFYRYRHADDFGLPEVAFLVCGFWYVRALAAVNRLDDAIQTFEQLLGYANHVGLLSEDVDPISGSQWGNCPQTYSHVGVINAAFDIWKKLDRPAFL